HRMPHEMIEFGTTAEQRGLSVIIAGAGGAAHLPGMLASTTSLPVIGVPVQLKTLDGMDSLLSIVQMPSGVPVPTVSINGARIAGPLGVKLVAAITCDDSQQLSKQLTDVSTHLKQQAQAKVANLNAQLAQPDNR